MSLILGNFFCLLSVICIAVSVVKKSKSSLIWWQIVDTIFCVLASIALYAYASLVTNLISLLRNVLSYKNKLTNKITLVLCGLCILIGLYVNNIGVFGWLPIAASTIYTLLIFFTKNEQQMRWAVIFNLGLWCIHDFYIKAYPSAIADIALSIWSAIQIFQNHKKMGFFGLKSNSSEHH